MKIIEKTPDLLVLDDSISKPWLFKLIVYLSVIIALIISILLIIFFNLPFYISFPILLLFEGVILIGLTTKTTITIDKINDKLIVQKNSAEMYVFPYSLNTIKELKLEDRYNPVIRTNNLQLIIVTKDDKKEKLLAPVKYYYGILSLLPYLSGSDYKLSQFGKQVASFLGVQYSDNLMNPAVGF